MENDGIDLLSLDRDYAVLNNNYIILTSVAVHDLRMNPSVCLVETGDTGARTGGDSTGNCSFNNTELFKLLNDIVSQNDLQLMYTQNISNILVDNLEITQETAVRLADIVITLSNLKDNGITVEGIVNDILLVAETLLTIQNNSQSLSTLQPKSCQEIRDSQPNSPSGYYHVNSQIVYCEMGELCNGTEGGWTRLAYLDMTDSTEECPPEFNLLQDGDVRACGRSADCTSIKFPSNGISYSEVCGRVVGYEYGSPDAVDTIFSTPEDHNDINSNYVDGVSITQGFPRRHVWTLMGGYLENFPATYNCPCNTPPGDTQDVQSFIGNDYFCESGNPNSGWASVLYSNDPLWDGEGCGTQEGDCCAAAGLPWFHKTFNYTTTNYLEIRVCGDEALGNEDTPFSFYELYVK